MAFTALAVAVLATACEPQTDAQPPVASVHFDPRLAVTVDDGGITAEPGPRDGAQKTDGTGAADWVIPSGTVVDLRNDAADERRVLITRTALDAGDGDRAAPVWVDTGAMHPGETVVLALTGTGRYAFAPAPDGNPGEPELTVLVQPRATS